MSERLGAIPVLDMMSKAYHGKTVTPQPRNGRFPTHAAIEPPKALNAFPLTGAGIPVDTRLPSLLVIRPSAS